MNAFMNQKTSWRRVLCLGVLAASIICPGAMAAPPALVSATAACGGVEVIATFDQPVEPTMGSDPFNYVVMDGFGNPNAVQAAEISPDHQTVTLTVEIPLGANPPYTLTMIFMCNPAFECTQEPDSAGIQFMGPPVACSVATSTLQPPNLQMVDVGLSSSSSAGNAQVRVFSDEPDGPGLHDGSYQNGILQLRARRAGQLDGRVYLIVVTSTDPCGNTGVCCTTVVVPQNGSTGALDAVNAQAAVAQSQCSANGAPSTPHEIALLH
jgi:hypothetical protein